MEEERKHVREMGDTVTWDGPAQRLYRRADRAECPGAADGWQAPGGLPCRRGGMPTICAVPGRRDPGGGGDTERRHERRRGDGCRSRRRGSAWCCGRECWDRCSDWCRQWPPPGERKRRAGERCLGGDAAVTV